MFARRIETIILRTTATAIGTRRHDRDAALHITATAIGGDWNRLKIIGGYYGVQGRTVNVTDVLRAEFATGAEFRRHQ